MKTMMNGLMLALALSACGGEAEAPVATSEPAPAADPAPAVPAPADPAPAVPAAEAAAPGTSPEICAAYYDRSVRSALVSAEENATRYPDIAATTTLGVGERAAWIEHCGGLAVEQTRCFTAYAAEHRDECLGFLLSPPPELVIPQLVVSLEELRALVATLPPA